MTSYASGPASAVADRLFERSDRWGWEYAPTAEEPYPYSPPSDPTPGWVKELTDQRESVAIRRPRAVRFLVGTVLWLVVAVLVTQLLGTVGLVLTVIVLLVRAFKFPRDAAGYLIAAAGLASRRRRARRDAGEYEHAYASWAADRAQWADAERRRVRTEDVWFPVRLDRASRIDVFGGVAHGWSGLLVTAGSGVLGAGRSVVVVDMSEEAVGAPLARLAAAHGIEVDVRRLPADLDRLDLLAGLDPEDVADLLVGAVQVLRPGNTEGRLIHAELLDAVAGCLDAPVSFSRLRDGLRVLRGSYDRRAARATLSASEVRSIAAHVDLVGSSPRAQDELQFLLSAVDMLARQRPRGRKARGTDDPGTGDPGAGDIAAGEGSTGAVPAAAASASPPAPGLPLSSPGLVVVANTERNPERRQLVDGLLVHGLLGQLGRTPGQWSAASPQRKPPLLVLAGVGDHVPHTVLEQLARRCRQAELRLVLMSEHLRGDLRHLLGAAGSASILMQLGNAEQAAAAAEFVGREHTFVVSQVSRQSGESQRREDSTQTGESRRKAEPGGDRSEMLWFGLAPVTRDWLTTGFTSETTAMYDESTQRTRGTSQETSVTYGETTSQEYRFQVEPTHLQALAPMTYVAVTAVDGERRVVAGTCDPLMAGLDRVSALSRDEVADTGATPAPDRGAVADDAVEGGDDQQVTASRRTPIEGGGVLALPGWWGRLRQQISDRRAR